MKLPVAEFGWADQFTASLVKVMKDYERWSIQDGRIVHDTGLSIVYHKSVGRYGYPRMELCLENMVPFMVYLETEHVNAYEGLLTALSRAQARPTYDKVAVLLKLAAE